LRPTYASFQALDRQKQIYLRGLSGIRPRVPADMDQLATQAREHLSAEAYAYVAGGAGRGLTMRSNREGFRAWQIRPRMLRDVSRADTGVELFGRTLPYPLLLAPIGVLEMAHREADRAVGRAAAGLGLPFIFSNQASVPMEEVAHAMGEGPRWFQLYWSKRDELVASLVQRAEACGCEAIVVTLDTTMLGWRIRDLDLAYLPFLRGKGIAQYTSDPVFQRLMDEPGPEDLTQTKRKLTPQLLRSVYQLLRNYPGSFFGNLRSGRPMKAVRTFINLYTNPSLSWDQLAFLREHTRRPILLKGILHPDDAQKALDHGMDGIIVSNHGGRQVDGAIGAIQALPAIAGRVQGKVPVLMDSGIRSGADVFKALALGATAVCLGRPYVYGLALDGEAGVRAVLENLLADFELTMRLSGCTRISAIGPDTLQKTPVHG